MKYLALLCLLLSSYTWAIAPEHEWDIAGEPGVFLFGSNDLEPSSIEYKRSSGQETRVVFYLEKNGKRIKVSQEVLNFKESCKDGVFRGVYQFDNRYYKIKNNRNRTYNVSYEGKCGFENDLIFTHDSFAGQVIGIFQIASTAVKKFGKIDRLDFWQNQLKIVYPGSGDYYNYNTVNITQGHYWDVVGHEVGHAIYDFANIGEFGGGNHRIDECYTDRLALSEGWASFFSAWLSVSLDDADAKFEYMVARRAPLEIENVPADVCRGPDNEWRVYSFLWDIIDRNQDKESMSELFQSMWDITRDKRYASIDELKTGLENNGFDPVMLNVLYSQNIEGQ